MKNSSSIVAVFYLILANNTPSATAADDFPVMKFNLLQTRKRCKRPSAKRAPGRHPGLFQISRLFRARFPADVSPGQEEQPMFRFKDKSSARDKVLNFIVISRPKNRCRGSFRQMLERDSRKNLNNIYIL